MIFRRDAKLIVEELDKILAFNNLLVSLKNHPDASRFARGVGPVSLIGNHVIFISRFGKMGGSGVKTGMGERNHFSVTGQNGPSRVALIR